MDKQYAIIKLAFVNHLYRKYGIQTKLAELMFRDAMLKMAGMSVGD